MHFVSDRYLVPISVSTSVYTFLLNYSIVEEETEFWIGQNTPYISFIYYDVSVGPCYFVRVRVV